MAPVYERRTGPRKFALDAAVAPAIALGSRVARADRRRPHAIASSAAKPAADPLPAADADIAFAPRDPTLALDRDAQTHLRAPHRIYLDRIERFDPKLRCVITLTRDLALAQAKQADQEIAAGKYRGPLHGIPWGAKDLVDTAGIPTTYGAEPFRNRVPHAGRRRGPAPARGRRRAGRQAEPGRAGAQRHLVRRPDHESLAAGRRRLRLQRRSRRRHCRRPGGLLDRQRNRRQHRQSLDALRHHRAASHLRPRAAHRRHDAVLVARQTGPHDPQRGGRHAGAAGDLRPRCRRRCERAQPSRFRFRRRRARAARRLLPRMDEGESRHRRGSRRAGDRRRNWAWSRWK